MDANSMKVTRNDGEWIWINGKTMPLADARIGVEDRGFLFADGVYEAMRLYRGRPFGVKEHLERLERSAAAIDLALPCCRDTMAQEIQRLADRSELTDGLVYLQITRGCSVRNHLFPDPSTVPPTLLFYTRPLAPLPAPGEGAGISLLSVPDERWKRCQIKTIALLPNVLAKNKAAAAGADEAVFVEDGHVNECSTSNLFAVVGKTLVTHPLTNKVLPGITRAIVLEIAASVGVGVQERPMREDEAKSADEVFITSSTRELVWVESWDGQRVGKGRCGDVTRRLHQAYVERVREEVLPHVAVA
jgi:D-alanine transaminase